MLDPISLRISKVRLRYTDNNSYSVPADSDYSESAFRKWTLRFSKTIQLMVEYPGIEPGVRKRGGFTVHCITIDASTPYITYNTLPTGIRQSE